MPNSNPVTPRYYPQLSEILDTDSLPSIFNRIEPSLNSVLSDVLEFEKPKKNMVRNLICVLE